MAPQTTNAPQLDGATLLGADYKIPQFHNAPRLDGGVGLAPSIIRGTPATGLVVKHGTTILAADKRTWRDPLGEVGSWSFSMHNTDPDLPDFDDVVTFWLDGHLRFAGPVIGKTATTHTAAGEARHLTELSGLGRLAITDKSVIPPSRGWDALPVETVRTQSYVAVDYDDSGWPYTKRIRKADSPTPYFPGRAMPEWWPDKDAWWVAPNRSDVSGEDAPVGRWPIRSDPITLDAGTIEVQVGLNNLGTVYFDGAVIADVQNAPVDGNRVRFDVSAGDHVIAARVSNFIRDTGFIASIWTIDDDGLLDDLVWSSDNDNTRALAYPPTAPSVTPGEAIRLLVEEIQDDESELTDLTLDFTDNVDSDGNPWSTTVEITTDVGRTLMEYLEALADWLCDIQMAPGSNTLRAWNWGTRGGTPGVTVAATTDRTTSETEGLVFNGLHIRANRFRIRYRRGYTEVDESGSDPTVTAFLDLHEVDDEDAAQTIGSRLLALRKDPSWAGTLTLAPVSSNPYEDFDNGDTVTHAANPDAGTSSRVRSITYTEDDNGERTWALELNDTRQQVQDRHDNWLKRAAMGSLAGGARVTSKSGDPIAPAQKLSSKTVAEWSFDSEPDNPESPFRPAEASVNLIEAYVELTLEDPDVPASTDTELTVRMYQSGEASVDLGTVTVPAGETKAELALDTEKCYRNVTSLGIGLITLGTGVRGADIQVRGI